MKDKIKSYCSTENKCVPLSVSAVTMVMFTFQINSISFLQYLNLRSQPISIYVYSSKSKYCIAVDKLPFFFSIMKTCIFKYTENFTTTKRKFSDKKIRFFPIYAQNIDCGYSLERLRCPQSIVWRKKCIPL